MKKINKISFRKMMKVLFLIALISFPVLLNAQDPYDPGDGGGDPGAPIDGGLSILIAAGVGYGVKKYRDNKKQKSQAPDKPLDK